MEGERAKKSTRLADRVRRGRPHPPVDKVGRPRVRAEVVPRGRVHLLRVEVVARHVLVRNHERVRHLVRAGREVRALDVLQVAQLLRELRTATLHIFTPAAHCDRDATHGQAWETAHERRDQLLGRAARRVADPLATIEALAELVLVGLGGAGSHVSSRFRRGFVAVSFCHGFVRGFCIRRPRASCVVRVAGSV